ELFHGDAVCLHRTFRTRLPDRHCRTRRGHRRQLQGRWLYLWEKYDSWRARWTYTVVPAAGGRPCPSISLSMSHTFPTRITIDPGAGAGGHDEIRSAGRGNRFGRYYAGRHG